MTTTTENTETFTFTEEDAWEAVRRCNDGEFGEFGTNNFVTESNGRGSLGAALAQIVQTHDRSVIEATSGQDVRQAIRQAGYAMLNTDDEALNALRNAVLSVLDEKANNAKPDTSTPEDKAERRKVGMRIIGESAWHLHMWLTGRYGEAYEQYWEVVVETMLYQFDNWSRGVYLVADESKRLTQYERRLTTQGKEDGLDTRGRRIVRGVLNRLWLVSQGATPEDEYYPVPSSSEFFQALTRDWRGEDGMRPRSGVGHGHGYWGYADAAYYMGTALEYWIDAMPGLSGAEQERRDVTMENLHYYIDMYTSTGRAQQYDQDTLRAFVEHANSIAHPTEPDDIPVVKSAEGLIEMLLANEKSAPDFYVAAVTNGALDLVDRFRDGEEMDNPVSVLRREVRKYGYLKFSGRGWSRAVLDHVLTGLRAEVADKPLTAEEWKARHERFKMAVQYVAGRYGEVQDMCSVLEKATGELGLDPVRKPTRIARLEGDGLVVDIKVETWRDSTNGLINHARNAWDKMSLQEREAAVVSRIGVHVNWDSMRSAF